MKKLFALIGGIVVLLGAVAGVLIYLKKKGIIDFDCICNHEADNFDLDCDCCPELDEEPAPAPEVEEPSK